MLNRTYALHHIEDSKDLNADTPQLKRGVSFATGLGHTNSNNDNNREREKIFAELFGKRELRDLKREYLDYLNEWKNMVNALYPGDPQQKREASLPQRKRAPDFTFGTALGHNSGKNNGQYVDSLKNKFNELFGDSDQ